MEELLNKLVDEHITEIEYWYTNSNDRYSAMEEWFNVLLEDVYSIVEQNKDFEKNREEILDLLDTIQYNSEAEWCWLEDRNIIDFQEAYEYWFERAISKIWEL